MALCAGLSHNTIEFRSEEGPMRACLLLCLLLWAEGLALAQTLPPSLGENPQETSIYLLAPFGPQGLSADLTPLEMLAGRCDTPSERAARPDAWRCQSADGRSFDPCFQDTFNTQETRTACLPNPSLADAVLIDNGAPLPQAQAVPPADQPWAVELNNGLICTRTSPAPFSIGGLEATYACGQETYIFGALQVREPFWRAYVGTPGRSARLVFTRLLRVWF